MLKRTPEILPLAQLSGPPTQPIPVPLSQEVATKRSLHKRTRECLEMDSLLPLLPQQLHEALTLGPETLTHSIVNLCCIVLCCDVVVGFALGCSGEGVARTNTEPSTRQTSRARLEGGRAFSGKRNTQSRVARLMFKDLWHSVRFLSAKKLSCVKV